MLDSSDGCMCCGQPHKSIISDVADALIKDVEQITNCDDERESGCEDHTTLLFSGVLLHSLRTRYVWPTQANANASYEHERTGCDQEPEHKQADKDNQYTLLNPELLIFSGSYYSLLDASR